MKKVCISLIVSSFIISGFSMTAYADEKENNVDAGITPDNEILYAI